MLIFIKEIFRYDIVKNYKTTGYICSISAAVSYGTNPLFALPMYNSGFGVNSVLFYRYFFAVIIYGCWLKLYKKISLKISFKEFLVLFCFGIIFSLSSIFLFEAFQYIDSGLACTILFVYPLLVALLSGFIFKEHIPFSIWIALILSLSGIYLLYYGSPDESSINLKGIILSLLSGLAYAIYIVGVRHVKILKNIKPDKLTFYVMLFGLIVYIWNLKFCIDLQPLNSWLVLACAVMLALFPTIISLETITFGIKLIGATKTAIIGALEPLTALCIGVLLFNETINFKIAVGLLLILSGVMVVIMHKKKFA